MPDAKANEAAVRELFDAFYTADAAAMETLVAPDFVTHSPGGGVGNLDGWKGMAVQILQAMPDIDTTIDDLVADEEKVAVRYTSRGTHSGAALFGVPAAGRAITMTGMELYHLVDGKIVEVWGEYNMSELFGQPDAE